MRDDTDGSARGKGKSKSKSVPGGAKDDAAFRGYINLSLTDADKADWAAWATTSEVWDCFNAQTGSGVNVSVKRFLAQGNFLASATQRDATSPNAGLCVTARGRDAGEAFTRVLWCLVILSRQERWEDTQPLANPDRW